MRVCQAQAVCCCGRCFDVFIQCYIDYVVPEKEYDKTISEVLLEFLKGECSNKQALRLEE